MNHGQLQRRQHFEPLASHFIASRRVWWWAQIWAQPHRSKQPKRPVACLYIYPCADNFFDNQDHWLISREYEGTCFVRGDDDDVSGNPRVAKCSLNRTDRVLVGHFSSAQFDVSYLIVNKLLVRATDWHDKIFHLVEYLRSPFLLFVRLYWGIQLIQSGWGKLHNLGKVTEFFTSLGLPAPAFTALAISSLEFFGGILLALGLFSRMISLVLTINLLMAYITADREALFSIFSDPDKFTAAAPYVFLVASIIVLLFGPGFFSADTLLKRIFGKSQPQSAGSAESHA